MQEARKYGEKYVPSSDAIIRKSIEAAYPDLRAFRDVLLLDEILTGKIPPVSELEARAQKYFYADNKLFIDTTLEELEMRFNIALGRTASHRVQELQGQTAYPGCVRGLVRIVTGRGQLEHFQAGEILVSPTTTPDFLSALKKAAGIITNEGGIICHAAIVARELKKPCVIGTRIATQALKDGDLVEVDATGGLVKVLKRA